MVFEQWLNAREIKPSDDQRNHEKQERERKIRHWMLRLPNMDSIAGKIVLTRDINGHLSHKHRAHFQLQCDKDSIEVQLSRILL